MTCRIVLHTVAVAILLAGCSSRPREFTPTVAALSNDRVAFDAAYAECNQLFVAGKLDRDGRLASGAVAAAAGATMAVAGGAAATSAGIYAGAAVASATVVLIPFVAIAGAFGVAKMKRANKEKAIKAAMSGCLHERGHDIAGWEKAKKKRGAALASSAN